MHSYVHIQHVKGKCGSQPEDETIANKKQPEDGFQ